jgi:hypothetical protein
MGKEIREEKEGFQRAYQVVQALGNRVEREEEIADN